MANWSTAVLAVAAVSSYVASAYAERGRHGKVVRVERPKALASDQVQLCGIDNSTRGSSEPPKLMCFGEAPRIGAAIDFVDDSGYRGRGRVVRVEAGLPMFSRCTENAGHTVYFEWLAGNGSDPGDAFGPDVAGVIGLGLNTSRAKLMNTPDRRPAQGDSSAYAIGVDADGDAHADLVVLVRECRDSAASLPGAGGSQYQPIFCLDYWLYAHPDWKLVNQTTVYNCM